MAALFSWLFLLQSTTQLQLWFILSLFYFPRMFIFELWCEKRKLLGELDLAEAIAAFIHLAFVFDLKYPKVSLFKCE